MPSPILVRRPVSGTVAATCDSIAAALDYAERVAVEQEIRLELEDRGDVIAIVLPNGETTLSDGTPWNDAWRETP